ncbi:MAG: hypothetical protein ACE5Z5_02670 [Candidatus Bathyarchaeia archaeon]
MGMVSKTTRLPKKFLRVIRFRAEREGLDESTVIRQLINMGIRRYVAKAYERGELSLREVSTLLGVTVRETLEVLWEEGVKGNVLASTQLRALEVARRLIEAG